MNRFTLLLLAFLLCVCGKEDELIPEIKVVSFEPAIGIAGTEVTITGENFGTVSDAVSISFNQIPASISTITSTKILIKVPANATTGKITVSKNAITIHSENEFVVPVLSPTEVAIGNMARIQGKNFDTSPGVVAVTVNGRPQTLKSVTDTEIEFRIAYGTTTGLAEVSMGSKSFSAGTLKVGSRWSELNDFPGSDRSSSVAFSIGNKFYVGLGYSVSSRTVHSDFWEYDPANNTWTRKADFPGGPRMQGIAFSINSKGYVGLGIGTGDFPQNTKRRDLWQFDPVTNQWTQMADLPGAGRVNAASFSVGDTGYVGLGYTSDLPFTVVRDFWSYKPSTNTWQQEADFPGSARFAPASFVIGNVGFVGGGRAGKDPGQETVDVYKFDPSTKIWTTVKSLPLPSVNTVNFSIGNLGYVGLGFSGIGVGIGRKFYEYDANQDEWILADNFPFDASEMAHYSAAGSIGSEGYVFFGENSTTTKSFWRYK